MLDSKNRQTEPVLSLRLGVSALNNPTLGTANGSLAEVSRR